MCLEIIRQGQNNAQPCNPSLLKFYVLRDLNTINTNQLWRVANETANGQANEMSNGHG